jgi:hypothetical protein
MTLTRVFFAVILAFVVSDLLGGTGEEASQMEKETGEGEWHGSISASTYLVQQGRDYVNPNITADHDWLHLELRYNYEAIKTGSIWLGYNFSFGDKLTFAVTPMLGGIFGDLTGVAPGYTLTVGYKQIELFSQGEYFVDAGNRAGNFFYTWSELGWTPVSWFRLGLAVDRTRAFGSDFEIRRGPFVGIQYKKVDFTTYWLSPGSRDATFVFAVAVTF